MPQSLLEAREDRWFVTSLRVDHAIGQEPGLGEPRREEILTREAPQDLALRARGDSRGEQRRRRAVDGAIAAAGDFVRRAERQSALRQIWSIISIPNGNTDQRRAAPRSRR
jgi:hypothetical protein